MAINNNGHPNANARYIHTTVDGQFDIHLLQRCFSITDRLAKGTYRSFHKNVSGSLSNGGDDGGNENIARKNEFASFQTLSCLFEPAQFVKCRRLFPGVEFLSILSWVKKRQENLSS